MKQEGGGRKQRLVREAGAAAGRSLAQESQTISKTRSCWHYQLPMGSQGLALLISPAHLPAAAFWLHVQWHHVSSWRVATAGIFIP